MPLGKLCYLWNFSHSFGHSKLTKFSQYISFYFCRLKSPSSTATTMHPECVAQTSSVSPNPSPLAHCSPHSLPRTRTKATLNSSTEGGEISDSVIQNFAKKRLANFYSPKSSIGPSPTLSSFPSPSPLFPFHSKSFHSSIAIFALFLLLASISMANAQQLWPNGFGGHHRWQNGPQQKIPRQIIISVVKKISEDVPVGEMLVNFRAEDKTSSGNNLT